MSHHMLMDIYEQAKGSPSNLARLTESLSRGVHIPVRVEGTDLIGFVIRLDDSPFGPVAVVHFPERNRVRVVYLDPEELQILSR